MAERTLWVWQSLPKVLEETPDRSWLKEGDAVENVQRLTMGKSYIIANIIYFSVDFIDKVLFSINDFLFNLFLLVS